MNNKPHKFKQGKTVAELIFEFEAMSHNGTVGFFEKTAFTKLLDYYNRKKLFDRALEVCGHAIAQHPFSGEFFARKASILVELNQPDQALELLDQAAIYSPSDVEVSLTRIEAYTLLGFYEEALSLIDDVKSWCGKDYLDEIYVRKAMIFENRNQHSQVFYCLRKALLHNPKNELALKRIWYCVDLSCKYGESIALHLKVIDEDPYSYVAWYNLGYAYNSLNQFEEAINAFEYAFIINNKFEFAYRDCAEACIALKKYEKAIQVYNETLEHFPPDGEILMKLGQCNEALGFISRAQTFYFQAIDLEPENAELHFQLGLSYAREGYKAASAGAHLMAHQLDKRNELYVASLADAYYKMGDLDKARKYFKKTTETAPEESVYWTRYAAIVLEMGETQRALEILDEANLYATGTSLLYCRVNCLLKTGKRKKALYILGEALHENFEMHKILLEESGIENDYEVMAVIRAFDAKL